MSFAADQPKDCEYHYRIVQATLNQHTVTIEYYIPEGAVKRPLVFILHGSAGAYSVKPDMGEPATANLGEKRFARACFVVAVPHYFESIGMLSVQSPADLTTQFPLLYSVVEHLLSEAEKSQTSAHGQPVFIIGDSYGSYLAVALALHRFEVGAVSEIAGGVPTGFTDYQAHHLRVLISHGEEDNVVPVASALHLSDLLNKQRVQTTVHLYKNTGHYLSAAVENDIIEQTVSFFHNTALHPKQGHALK